MPIRALIEPLTNGHGESRRFGLRAKIAQPAFVYIWRVQASINLFRVSANAESR